LRGHAALVADGVFLPSGVFRVLPLLPKVDPDASVSHVTPQRSLAHGGSTTKCSEACGGTNVSDFFLT